MFKGIDPSELEEALTGKISPDLVDDNRPLINQMSNETAPVFKEYLEAHIKHIAEHNIGNHTDYVPIYKELLKLYDLEDEDKFSWWQMYCVLLPLMWC